MKKELTLMAATVCLLASCATKTSPSGGTDSLKIKQERNKAVVMASENAFIKKDAEGSLKDFAPGFTIYGSRGSKPITSIDTLVKNSKDMFHAFPDWTGENLKAIAFGDTVLVMGTWSGTFKNDLPGVKANGKSVKYDDVEVFVLNDAGKIVSQSNTQSMNTFAFQLGLLVPNYK